MTDDGIAETTDEEGRKVTIEGDPNELQRSTT
jgi:hypothetical protein